MGAVMETTGLSLEAVRSLTPDQVSALLDGMGQVREARARAAKETQG